MKITVLEKLFNQNPSLDDIIRECIQKAKNEDAFYVCDVSDLLRKHKAWMTQLPRVRPFYAVKCNSAPIVLETLSSLGIGFDCASKTEMDSMLDLGVPPEDIIYANPCKSKAFICHAASMGVDTMTFDNELELYKLRQKHPNAKAVLRLRVDDSHSACRLGLKFGADLERVPFLLAVAKKIGVTVIGCSFHVGSGCASTEAYRSALASAKQVFVLAEKMGFNMSLLDIGGGFPGTSCAAISFEDTAKAINEALDLHFPQFDDDGCKSKVQIIGEPGRYYVASAFTLVTNIIAKRIVPLEDAQGGTLASMYYLNDGVYGSFNCAIFDHWKGTPVPFAVSGGFEGRACRLSTLWGPTCDSMDCILQDVLLPEMNIGEWVVFREMGAYTLAAGSTFNGFSLPAIKYYLPTYTAQVLQTLKNWSRIFRLVEESDDEDFLEEDDSLLATFSPGTGSLPLKALGSYIHVH